MTHAQSRNNLETASEGETPIARADLAAAKSVAPAEDTATVRFLGAVSEFCDQPPLVASSLLVTGAGLVAQDRRLTRTGLRMLASHLLATGMKSFLKNRIDRHRPGKAAETGEHDIEPGTSEDGEYRSFPSGHTAGGVAIASAIARDYPGAAPYAYGAAALAAGIQIPRLAHYPSDIVVGAGIGFVAEAIVNRVIETVEPVVAPQDLFDDDDKIQRFPEPVRPAI